MEKPKINHGQLVLCYCPEWCSINYQVAIWDGKKFDYPDAPNDNFDACVEGYLKLNEHGTPISKKWHKYDSDTDRLKTFYTPC